jgi:hypothetical protein
MESYERNPRYTDEQQKPVRRGLLRMLGGLLTARGGEGIMIHKARRVSQPEIPAGYDPKYDLTSGQFDMRAWQDRERREAPAARWEFDAPSPIPPEISEGTLTSEDFKEALDTVRKRHHGRGL